MRRIVLVTLLAILAVPTTALATRLGPGDGKLEVRNGEGAVSLVSFKGSAIGLLRKGEVEVDVAAEVECEQLPVFDEKETDERFRLTVLRGVIKTCVYDGKNMSFRFIDTAQQRIRFTGRGISLAAAGRGTVVLKGNGGAVDGVYASNSEQYKSLPDELTRFPLAPQASAP